MNALIKDATIHSVVLGMSRSQAKAAVAYKYDKGVGENDESEPEVTTYHGEEGEDKALSSESEYGERVYMKK